MPYDITHSPAMQGIQTSGSVGILRGCLPSQAFRFFPVGYLVGGRENNVHSGLMAICFWEASERGNREALLGS